ncbi:MAG: hypothetical protein ACTHQQ_19140 [Solirubrobacteraceae bacterium]
MAGGPVWGAASADLNATVLEWRPGNGPAEHVNEERDVLYVVLEIKRHPTPPTTPPLR